MHLLMKGLTIWRENLIYKEGQKITGHGLVIKKVELFRIVWDKIKELF